MKGRTFNTIDERKPIAISATSNSRLLPDCFHGSWTCTITKWALALVCFRFFFFYIFWLRVLD